MGSHEFVEEFYSELRERAIIYINADTIIKGNTHFTADSIPILHDFIHDTAKMIPDHRNPAMKVFDTWAQYQTDQETGKPFIGEAKVKSDYAPFIHLAGIPIIHVGCKSVDREK